MHVHRNRNILKSYRYGQFHWVKPLGNEPIDQCLSWLDSPESYKKTQGYLCPYQKNLNL